MRNANLRDIRKIERLVTEALDAANELGDRRKMRVTLSLINAQAAVRRWEADLVAKRNGKVDA